MTEFSINEIIETLMHYIGLPRSILIMIENLKLINLILFINGKI